MGFQNANRKAVIDILHNRLFQRAALSSSTQWYDLSMIDVFSIIKNSMSICFWISHTFEFTNIKLFKFSLPSFACVIFQEVENILRYAVERNMIRRSLGAKRHAFEAWRQVVETSFAICHYDVFTGDRREAVILSLLQDMLLKVTF